MILSICIPSYNRIKFLENCLNSILIASKNVNNFEFEFVSQIIFQMKTQNT